MSFIQILSKAMAVSQLVQVGFGPGPDVRSLALALQNVARLRGSVSNMQKYSLGEGCACCLTLASLESSC